MRQSTIESVEHVLKNPDGPASTQHRQWMAQKKRDGWVFGPTRDDKRKIHPLLVPYSKLPRQERLKDALLIAIVKSLSGKR